MVKQVFPKTFNRGSTALRVIPSNSNVNFDSQLIYSGYNYSSLIENQLFFSPTDLQISRSYELTSTTTLSSDEILCYKPLKGNGVIKGTLFEKTVGNIYTPPLEYELFDRDSRFSYGKYPITNGEFELTGVNLNNYTMHVTDPTKKYNGKIIDIDVVDVDESIIEPVIILGGYKCNMYDSDDTMFEQNISIDNCLGDTNLLTVGCMPSWMNLVKLSETEYVVRGNTPLSYYGTVLDLEFNLNDYRESNIVKSNSISRSYNFKKKGSFNLFDGIDNPNYTYVGDVSLSSYNNITGVSVRSKLKTVKFQNNPGVIQEGSNFTIMAAFTTREFVTPTITHNRFVANSNGSGRFWIGTSPTTFPKLVVNLGTGSDRVTNVNIQPNTTYFVKIIRCDGVTTIYVNNKIAYFAEDNGVYTGLNSELMLGDGGWGTHTSDVIFHEYNYIADFPDISNSISFKCSPTQTTYLHNSDVLAYSFDKVPMKYRSVYTSVNTDLFEIDNYEFLTNNACKDRVNIFEYQKFKTYTISFDITAAQSDAETTIFEFSVVKVNQKDDVILFYIKDVLVTSRNVTINDRTNFDIVYDGSTLIVYNGGIERSRTNVGSDMDLYGPDVFFGYDKTQNVNNMIVSTLHNCRFVKGVQYVGNHNYEASMDWGIAGTGSYFCGDIQSSKSISISEFGVSELSKPKHVGVTVDTLGGYDCWKFNETTDYVEFTNNTSMKTAFNGLDMTFDFYWSGVRTGSKTQDTILSSLNTPTQTGFDTRSFTIRVDESGTTPRLYYGFAGYFGTHTGSNKLKIGWNTIRIHRPANDYSLQCYLNGIRSSAGGYYDKLMFGDLGHLVFGYSSYIANGLVGCGIKNFKLETF